MMSNTGKSMEDENKRVEVARDKYRSFLDDAASTEWRHGGPPIYDQINLLFEHGRTKAMTNHLISSFFLFLQRY